MSAFGVEVTDAGMIDTPEKAFEAAALLKRDYDAGASYRNVARNWRDVQLPDGWGRNTAPQPHDEHWGGAMWSSAGLISPSRATS